MANKTASAAKQSATASKKKAPPKKAAAKKAAKKSAAPKGVTQKQYEALQTELTDVRQQLADAQTALEKAQVEKQTAEEIMHQNSGEDQTAIRDLEAKVSELQAQLMEKQADVASAELKHSALNDEYNKLQQWANEQIDKIQAIADNWKAKYESSQLKSDVKGIGRLKGLPAWIIGGLVVLGLIYVFFVDPYLVQRSDEKDKKYEQQVRVLTHEKDSIQQKQLYYKRMSEEQAKQTDDAKAKAAIVNAIGVANDQEREQERINDKKKVDEAKNAIRHAASDQQLIDVLTGTLRQ